MKKILFTMIIIWIVLVSGCTIEGFDFFKKGMGTVEQVIEENDIIKVQKMELIGEEPVLKETPFTLYFEIQNMHDERDVESVSAYLTNWEPCGIVSIGRKTKEELDKELNGEQAKYPLFKEGTKISAGGAEAVEIEFNAETPTTELPGKCNIQYLIDYKFDAKTSFSGISVIDSEYLRELRRAGKKPEASPLINVGIGPLKIMIETDVSMPAEDSEDTQRYIPMTLWIENRGAEVYGDIGENKVILKVPEEFLKDKGDNKFEECDRFVLSELDSTKVSIGNEKNLIEGATYYGNLCDNYISVDNGVITATGFADSQTQVDCNSNIGVDITDKTKTYKLCAKIKHVGSGTEYLGISTVPYSYQWIAAAGVNPSVWTEYCAYIGPGGIIPDYKINGNDITKIYARFILNYDGSSDNVGSQIKDITLTEVETTKIQGINYMSEMKGGINLLYLTNTEPIPMLRGISTKMRCKFASPPDVEHEKEYFILAEMNYNYKIRGERLVQTKPSG